MTLSRRPCRNWSHRDAPVPPCETACGSSADLRVMFAFFSNRLGCIGSLIVSVIGSLVTFGSLRPLSLGWRAMVTSSKESDLPTATSSREPRSFSHRGSISARIWRNNLAANFARIPIVFSAGKTPRRTSRRLCRWECQPRRAARHCGCGRRYAGGLRDQ